MEKEILTDIHCTGKGAPKLVFIVLEKRAPKLVLIVMEKELLNPDSPTIVHSPQLTPVTNLPAMRSSGVFAATHTVDRMAPMNAKIMLINIVPFLKHAERDLIGETIYKTASDIRSNEMK